MQCRRLSGGLEVCSIVRLFIWLHLAAGLVAYQSVWHSVCLSACPAGCASCCSFWCPFCCPFCCSATRLSCCLQACLPVHLSVNLVICRSVLLPAGRASINSSANLADREPFWLFICSFFPAGRGPIWSSARSLVCLSTCSVGSAFLLHRLCRSVCRPNVNLFHPHTFIHSAGSAFLLHCQAIPRRVTSSTQALHIDSAFSIPQEISKCSPEHLSAASKPLPTSIEHFLPAFAAYWHALHLLHGEQPASSACPEASRQAWSHFPRVPNRSDSSSQDESRQRLAGVSCAGISTSCGLSPRRKSRQTSQISVF